MKRFYNRLMGTTAMNDSEPDEESPLLAPLLTTHDNAQQPTGIDSGVSHTSFEDDMSVTSSRVSDLPWDSYMNILEKRPLLVKSVTAFFILGGGDLSGQAVEHLRGTAAYSGVDWPRAARFATFGVLGTPWAHYYFHYLDYYFPPTLEPFTMTTAIKLLIDQGIQAPLLLAFIISALSIMKGEGFEGMKNDMSRNYVDALFANCKQS